MRPTPTPHDEPAEPTDDAPESADTDQGRGGTPAEKPTRTRRRTRADRATAEKLNKRGLHLADSVWERLQLEAIRKKTTVSAVAGDVLDRNLPRLSITRDG